MTCVVGIDLGSTTTKAVLLDEHGAVLGRGITNSRSNYGVACAVAREEALIAARLARLERGLDRLAREAPAGRADAVRRAGAAVPQAFRLELYLDDLADLGAEMRRLIERGLVGCAATARTWRAPLDEAAGAVLAEMARSAPGLFLDGQPRRSDFFRDLAGAAFMEAAERACADGRVPFERLTGAFDRAMLTVETRLKPAAFDEVARRAVRRVLDGGGPDAAHLAAAIDAALGDLARQPLDEVAFVGTGYGRQTLPFPRAAVRSEILCHGRGAHRVCPGTRTVLDIGGQDTKAIQVDAHGVVTSFQMNDRCAAGCGRYLGYIADELNLGLHELGPLALQARRSVRVNSTCTVFAGAELRERLALGQRREDILAGLHRAIMLRAMSLLARSGGISDEFTFTGGVCKNPMATKVLAELVRQSYGDGIRLNIHPDSIYMGALGAALFALDDLAAGTPQPLRAFDDSHDAAEPPCGRSEPAARTDTIQMEP